MIRGGRQVSGSKQVYYLVKRQSLVLGVIDQIGT